MKKFWLVIVMFVANGLACDGADGADDSTCTECWCNADYCPDGGDADADRDGDTNGDTVDQYGTLTVTSTPVTGAAITLDDAPTGHNTDYTLELPVGSHNILLSSPGRIQHPSPKGVSVAREGTNVNVVLYADPTGQWREESSPYPEDWWVEIQPPDRLCPETWVRVVNVNPVGTLCIEADDTLSLCRNHAEECDAWVENGQISADGQRVDFTIYWVMTGRTSTLAFTKVP